MRQEPDRFLFFKKALYQVKTSDLQLDFTIISIALKLAYNRNKLFKTFMDFEINLIFLIEPFFLHVW